MSLEDHSTTRPASQDRSPPPSSRTRPTSPDRSPPLSTTRPTSRDRSPLPSSQTRPTSPDRSPLPPSRTRLTSPDRSPLPPSRTRPTSRDRSPPRDGASERQSRKTKFLRENLPMEEGDFQYLVVSSTLLYLFSALPSTGPLNFASTSRTFNDLLCNQRKFGMVKYRLSATDIAS